MLGFAWASRAGNSPRSHHRLTLKAQDSHSRPSAHARRLQRGADAADDVGGTVLGDDPDDGPAHLLEHLDALNVFDVLPSVTSVLIAVVFDGDQVLLPAEVEISDGNAVHAGHRDLGLRPRESSIDEKQA